MGNVRLILGTMRKFTPEGQKKISASMRNKEAGAYEINRLSENLKSDVLDKTKSANDIFLSSAFSYMRQNSNNVNNNLVNQIVQKVKQQAYYHNASESIRNFAEIYKTKKVELYRFAKKDLHNRKLAQTIKEFQPSDNLETDMRKYLEIFSNLCTTMGPYEYGNVWLNQKLNKNFRYVQKAYFEKIQEADLYLKLMKIIIPPTKDTKVKEIEKMLKKQYKLDYIHLENMERAKEVQKSLAIAKEKNVRIPNNIIVHPYSFGNADGVSMSGSNLKSTVYIAAQTKLEQEFPILKNIPEKTKEKEYLTVNAYVTAMKGVATTKPEHIIMHEFMHGTQPLPLSKRIHKKYINCVHDLSQYAFDCFNKNNNEITVELLTKQVLEGLNEQEEKLLKILKD